MNYYYRNTISSFLQKSTDEIIGSITRANEFDVTFFQNKSWELQIPILKNALQDFQREIFFEYSIPRMGKRVDTLIIIKNIVFVVEFKVGESHFLNSHIEQVWDYALDLKNFHKTSHNAVLVPVLIATESKTSFTFTEIVLTSHNDNLTLPVKINSKGLKEVIQNALCFFSDEPEINIPKYVDGGYMPTPTIIEAAVSLYTSHSVENITRSDASAKNLTLTTDKISEIIDIARNEHKKIICFVTGVPGAGKTLVGLNVATSHLDNENGNASVYLSGNKSLVEEALARDKVQREREKGIKITKISAKQAVKTFIQISLDSLKHTHSSKPRNPLIADVCFKGGLIDAWGRGTVRIIETCKEAGLPEPELTERDGGFLVTLFKDNLTEEQLVTLGLNARQVKAVLYVKEKGKITNKEYQEINDISNRTATNERKELVEKLGLMRMSGAGAGTFYEFL
ncbi:MAG: DNA/RNA helicase domain-containing protein [Proteiniphilum sp.]|jgi:hypothetical protein|uniref:ATP-binding protein n=1 Tax=Proteiniphilum sp. TaxID=1926877 RepID=UPI002B2074FD|nr:ATP-binding protein [Proteiniphilum sp.]MEA5126923.1 DNA/RNA helicase domain-containing protein [Proteiniphilum sp.]